MAFISCAPLQATSSFTSNGLTRKRCYHVSTSRVRASKRQGHRVTTPTMRRKKPNSDGLRKDYVFDENKPLLMSDMETGLPAVPGFTDYSELLNGRAAMIGFIAVLAIEFFTGRGFLSIVSDFTGGI